LGADHQPLIPGDLRAAWRASGVVARTRRGISDARGWLGYNAFGGEMEQGSGIRVGRILNIPIFLHPSWFIIFALITFSLGTQFKQQHPSWSPSQHWALGIITAILFFTSVVVHELGHSVVAMRYKIPVQSITLFVFGGLARIGREPTNARQEFNIGIAGPITSFLLSGGFYLLAKIHGASEMVVATSTWLAEINFVLGAFNLVPGFPLDGGRIFRAVIWGLTNDFAKATRYAARSGQVIAYLMIFGGIAQFVTGDKIGGLWLAFIGWFLLTAAQESYAQVTIRSALTGIHASDVMTQEIPSIGREDSIENYVQEVLRTGRRCYVVRNGDIPVGLITLDAARQVPREEWTNTSVQAAMMPLDKIHWAQPAEPVLNVLERMQREDINQMPVLDGGQIVGMIARDTILRALQTRLQAGHLAEQ
jgi:Zn-dependent protease/predicted transcriptional regulator